MMRLVAWNILHGGGSRRMATIIVELLEQRADVIVLNEFRATMGGQLQAVLRDHGYEWQVMGADPKGRNVVLVAAREAIEFVEDTPLSLRDRIVEVQLAQRDTTLLAVHIPDESQPTRRREAWQHVTARAKVHASGRCVVAGDFNTGRHKLDEAGETFSCITFLGKLATNGYVDAYRTLHGNRWEETWVAPNGWQNGDKPLGKRELRGFRLDGGFVSAALKEHVKSAAYAHAVRETKVSDHSIFLLEIEIPGERVEKKCEKTRENSG